MQFSKSVFFSLFGFGLTIGLLGAAPAMAAEGDTTPVVVTADITDSCTIGAAAATLDFGTLAVGDANPGAETTTISVDCNAGTPWTVSADLQGDDTATDRLLTGSNGGVLNWELFQGTDCTGNVFGDTNDANEAAGTDTAGGVEDINIAACLLSNPIPQVPGGTYTETVTMTLGYT